MMNFKLLLMETISKNVLTQAQGTGSEYIIRISLYIKRRPLWYFPQVVLKAESY